MQTKLRGVRAPWTLTLEHPSLLQWRLKWRAGKQNIPIAININLFTFYSIINVSLPNYLQVSSSPSLISHFARNWIVLKSNILTSMMILILMQFTCLDESWSPCWTHTSVTWGTRGGRGTQHVCPARSRDPPHWSWGRHTRVQRQCHSPSPDQDASWDHIHKWRLLPFTPPSPDKSSNVFDKVSSLGLLFPFLPVSLKPLHSGLVEAGLSPFDLQEPQDRDDSVQLKNVGFIDSFVNKRVYG